MIVGLYITIMTYATNWSVPYDSKFFILQATELIFGTWYQSQERLEFFLTGAINKQWNFK